MLLAILAGAVCLVLDIILVKTTHLKAPGGVIPYLVTTTLMSLLIYGRARLIRMAVEEEKDEALEREERKETALFRDGSGDDEPFSIRYTQQQFERLIVPLIAPVLMLLHAYLGWRTYHSLDGLSEEPTQHLLAASFLAGQALIMFLLSRYVLGLSHGKDGRIVRGAGILLGLLALVSLLGAVGAVVSVKIYAPVDRIVTMILAGLLGILAIESLLNTIGQLYRPRGKRKELLTSYESKLAAMVTDPTSWARNLAQAFDYQFGFKVSETWFYQFLQNALFPLLIFQCLVLYFLSCFVFLDPSEEAILEQFGKPLKEGWHLDSGFHLKRPWPFETARRFPTKLVQSVAIGFEEDHSEPRPTQQGSHEGHDHAGHDCGSADVVVWTQQHAHEEHNFLVAGKTGDDTSDLSALNFLNISLLVRYRISDIRAYAYNYSDPARMLKQAGYRAVSTEAVSNDIFSLMGGGQMDTVNRLEATLQQEVDRLKLGIKILVVEVMGIHPPVAVTEAFESIVASLEQKEAEVLAAEIYKARQLPKSRAEAQAKVLAQEAYQLSRRETAAAEAVHFEKSYEAYKKAPDVYKARQWLATIERSLKDVPKWIVPHTIPSEVIELHSDKPLGPEFFEDLKPEDNTGE